MAGTATIGERVVLLDDTGDWRGGATAWHLAQAGHDVTIVTSAASVGVGIQRTAGDGALRARLAALGARWFTETILLEWHDRGAMARSLLDGAVTEISADALVLATTNEPDTRLPRQLTAVDPDGRLDLHLAGDVVAARLAVHAIYEGRVIGMRL
jgi:NADPH-dependent 2,4-dienoyl-CoA reductase/sulfur reductase-like enzyme